MRPGVGATDIVFVLLVSEFGYDFHSLRVGRQQGHRGIENPLLPSSILYLDIWLHQFSPISFNVCAQFSTHVYQL